METKRRRQSTFNTIFALYQTIIKSKTKYWYNIEKCRASNSGKLGEVNKIKQKHPTNVILVLYFKTSPSS